MYFDAPPMEFKNQILADAEYINAKGCHLACNPGTLLPETSCHSSEFWCGQNRDLEISSLMPSLKSIPERLSSSSSVESTKALPESHCHRRFSSAEVLPILDCLLSHSIHPLSSLNVPPCLRRESEVSSLPQ